jgi:hypothetical protein
VGFVKTLVVEFIEKSEVLGGRHSDLGGKRTFATAAS